MVRDRDAQLRSLSAEVEELKARVAGLEDLNERQKRTIKVQSDTISAPTTSVPFDQPAGSQRPPGGFAPPVRPPTRPHRRASPPPRAIMPTPVQRGPVRREESAQSGQSSDQWHSNHPPTSSRGSVPPQQGPFLLPPPPPRQPFDNPVTALVPHMQALTAYTPNWPTTFASFFAQSTQWAHTYCSAPPPPGTHLPTPLINSLKEASTASSALPLLSHPSTRYFLIASLLNRLITPDIFRFHIVRGFSATYDERFAHNRERLQDPEMTEHGRNALEEVIAMDVRQLRNEATFPAFQTHLTTRRTDSLWKQLSPLLSPTAIHPAAYTALTQLVAEAFRIGFLMASEANRFEMEYFTVIPVVWFHAGTMVCCDPNVRDDGATIQRKGLKIRLCVNPCVGVTEVGGGKEVVCGAAVLIEEGRR